MRGVRSKDEYWMRLASNTYERVGNSDCGLYQGGYKEGCPLVIIHRDIDEVEASLARIGIYGVRSVLEEGNLALDYMEGLHVRYEDIDVRLEEIHYHCVDTPFSEIRAKQFINQNIQLAEIVPDLESIRLWG
jgi:hypothetical protein